VSRARQDRTWPLVATCTRGLEDVLRGELLALGHEEAAGGRGVVSFRGGLDEVYRANLWLRTAMRVLRQLAEGPAADRDSLYRLARAVAWDGLMKPGQTLAVEPAGRTEAFRSTAFAALTVKDAVVDSLREAWGFRPDVERSDPDLRVHLHLAGERAGIAVDSSGEPLSHRGYRPRGGPAPLSESLAAGVLLIAGYDGTRHLVDPMAGTGTIAIEAALIATRTPPGWRRTFACERWPQHDPARLGALRDAASRQRRAAPAAILASDSDPRAVAAIRRNLKEAGVADAVVVEARDARELRLPGPGAMIVTNPPYGERLGDAAELTSLYRSFGDALKRRAAGGEAWLLVGSLDLVKAVGLRPTRRVVLFNGPIECRLLRYDLYEGGRAPAKRAAGAPDS
jgi:putative N6-adenine-specific DNA methylase